MAGKEKWTDPKVTAVFKKWAEILPFHAKDYAGLTWQDAANTLVQKKSGMYLLGLFVSAQFAATKDPADLADLDFFPFPTLGTAVRRRERARRPDRHLADRGQVARTSPPRPDAAKAYLEFWAKGSTQLLMFKNQPGLIPTATDADTSTYSDLQKKAVEIVCKAQKITQFLDRDTRSDFAGANGMQTLPADVPREPDPGPRGLPEDHPGLLGLAAAALLTGSVILTPCPSLTAWLTPRSTRSRPARSPDRRGGRMPPSRALEAAATGSPRC